MTGRRPLWLPLLLVCGWLWIPEAPAAPARISGAPLVYLRGGPGPGHEPIGVLSEGETVEVLESQGTWSRIRIRDGTTGYVYSSFLTAAPAAEPGSASPGGKPTPTIPAASSPSPPPGSVAADVFPPEADVPPSEVDLSPSEPGIERDELLGEVAQLRSEIEELKHQLIERLPEAPPELSVVTPPSGDPLPSSLEQADPDLRTLAASIISLVIGWILGSLFARRRSRSARPRLRF